MKQSMFVSCAFVCLVFSCKKPNETIQRIDVNAEETIARIPGRCPYRCPDTRCALYEIGCPPPREQPAHIVLANSIGTLHNEALAAIDAKVNFSEPDKEKVFNSMLSAVGTSLSDNGISISSELRSFLRTWFYQYRANNRYLLQHYPTDSIINHYSSLAQPMLTLREKNLYNKAVQIFHFDASNMSKNAELDTIIYRAYRLKDQVNALSWNSNGEGALVAGFINISLSSAEYWKSRYATALHPFDYNPTTTVSLKIPRWLRWGMAPQLDAAGYLVSWAKSWAIDEEPSERVRIKNGLVGGAVASGLRLPGA